MDLPNVTGRVATEGRVAARPQAGEVWRTLVRVIRASTRHRTTGHAAEMAFFAVLTLVPSTVAVGSVLGAPSAASSAPGTVADAENAAVAAVRTLMGPDLAEKVIAPFIHAQLAQPRGGVARRRPARRLVALEPPLHVDVARARPRLRRPRPAPDARPALHRPRRSRSVSVAVVALTVELMVTGPLGDPDGAVARRLGIGRRVLGRLVDPALAGAARDRVGFLVCLYRFSPNVRQSWRECLPGALRGRGPLDPGRGGLPPRGGARLHSSAGVAADDPTVAVIGQAVNAVVATVLWAYLASVAILVGGELNVELRAGRAPAAAAAPKTAAYRPY